MKSSTKNILRLISVLLALSLVLMEIDVIPNILNYKFWFLIGAYGLLLITYGKS